MNNPPLSGARRVPRLLLIIVGPLVIVACCYQLTIGVTARSQPTVPSAPATREFRASTSTDLEAACRERVRKLRSQWHWDGPAAVFPPFVIIGDSDPSILELHYRETIEPICESLEKHLLSGKPTAPITVVLASDSRSLRRFAQRWDNRSVGHYYGYYLRKPRRIMVDVSTGNGTLAHELLHALMHFDFPQLPEWLDEGVASLYEQSRFSSVGNRLEGVVNWRFDVFRRALTDGTAQTLEELVKGPGIRASHQSVDYAHARCFCLYLQDVGKLKDFYSELRDSAAHRATVTVLRAQFDNQSLSKIDQDFQKWIERQSRQRMGQRQPDSRRTAPDVTARFRSRPDGGVIR